MDLYGVIERHALALSKVFADRVVCNELKKLFARTEMNGYIVRACVPTHFSKINRIIAVGNAQTEFYG